MVGLPENLNLNFSPQLANSPVVCCPGACQCGGCQCECFTCFKSFSAWIGSCFNICGACCSENSRQKRHKVVALKAGDNAPIDAPREGAIEVAALGENPDLAARRTAIRNVLTELKRTVKIQALEEARRQNDWLPTTEKKTDADLRRLVDDSYAWGIVHFLLMSTGIDIFDRLVNGQLFTIKDMKDLENYQNIFRTRVAMINEFMSKIDALSSKRIRLKDLSDSDDIIEYLRRHAGFSEEWLEVIQTRLQDSSCALNREMLVHIDEVGSLGELFYTGAGVGLQKAQDYTVQKSDTDFDAVSADLSPQWLRCMRIAQEVNALAGAVLTKTARKGLEQKMPRGELPPSVYLTRDTPLICQQPTSAGIK